jgi:hypothetical protein
MNSSSNRMLGLALSKQSCPRMERPTSLIHQIGLTNHLERDISCAILQGQASVLAVHLRPLYQESVQLVLLMEWMVTAQRSQHLHRARGRLLKVFPQVRHYRSASIDSSTAILRTLGKGNSRASAISRTSPARVRLTRHCQRRSLSKKQIVRLTTKALSWPDIYQGYTQSNQLHTNPLIQANYTDTPTKQKAV